MEARLPHGTGACAPACDNVVLFLHVELLTGTCALSEGTAGQRVRRDSPCRPMPGPWLSTCILP